MIADHDPDSFQWPPPNAPRAHVDAFLDAMVGYHDPDQFVREAGSAAAARKIDNAAPLQAELVADAWTNGPPNPRFGAGVRVTEAALLDCAAWCLRTVTVVRRGERRDVEDRSADLQRAVIAVAARGMLSHARCEAIPADAFTGPERLLAWVCTCRAVLVRQRRTSFAAARRVLGSVRMELPREVELEVIGGAADELDAAEDITDVSPSAVAVLLQDARARQTRAWLAPVLDAIDRGEPLADTGARLHEAAGIFEGRG